MHPVLVRIQSKREPCFRKDETSPAALGSSDYTIHSRISVAVRAVKCVVCSPPRARNSHHNRFAFGLGVSAATAGLGQAFYSIGENAIKTIDCEAARSAGADQSSFLEVARRRRPTKSAKGSREQRETPEKAAALSLRINAVSPVGRSAKSLDRKSVV